MTKPHYMLGDFELLDLGDTVKVPSNVAVCPYCDGLLRATAESCVEVDGWLVADHLHVECEAEPPPWHRDWPAFDRKHSRQPYIYQLPVDQTVLGWFNENYRISE